ncbi:MAG: hypothetical protein Q8764_02030 [Pigeon pea little leaf phytoplasma]|uniref:Uncharacterized protein n=1 Tax=Candidatus Phytoplasma fabacearum TaxID=2982628 RepID=A0ABU8ZST0_9MOLU|nr:hypothetical protein ['Bituminaria bituminosa' little leaf phytoplasma]MDV3148838.1 hypothetical protein [Pigeon pea little leaf phytoplasma]MDO7983761.1 hypothetical protein ['Bituminaria bituminosa' little leaf phytoplasma]MDO8024030.1 hypothetical protein ['Bituminaria bituminosa' little leaf phytoplasma]MDO8030776.1 hypothetical protein ['Bituminaria bituminosa' little leaf phytoplasma]MDV3154248.1 hypothetical protein [Pigeon pea little leaf phytoplasma]
MFKNKWDVVWENLIYSKFWQKKWFIMFFYILNILIFVFIVSWKLNNRIVYINNQINLSNVFDSHQIYQYQMNDPQESEETIICLKSMLIFIIQGIFIFSFKKGFLGITLGTFLGVFLGLGLARIYPSFIYLLELIYKGVFKV